MPNYTSTLTGEQIESSLLASKAASEISGMVKYNGTGTGTSVSMANPGTDYGVPPLIESSDPTVTTVGATGQFLFNTTTSKLWICVNAQITGYTWSQIT